MRSCKRAGKLQGTGDLGFHSHEPMVFEARRVFTDRTEPMALFDRAFAAPQKPGDHRVITWYGVGGQGKTRLHNEIRARLAKNKKVALAGLDFHGPSHRRLENAMLKLRGDLAGRGLSFPILIWHSLATSPWIGPVKTFGRFTSSSSITERAKSSTT